MTLETGRFIKSIVFPGPNLACQYNEGDCIVVAIPGEMGYALWGQDGDNYHRLGAAESVGLWPEKEVENE